jgi:hypothetical protein
MIDIVRQRLEVHWHSLKFRQDLAELRILAELSCAKKRGIAGASPAANGQAIW